MARPRGLYAGVGPGLTPSRDGVLLHGNLLGDLASHEAAISHDITPRVSLSLLLFLYSDLYVTNFSIFVRFERWGRVDNFNEIYFIFSFRGK